MRSAGSHTARSSFPLAATFLGATFALGVAAACSSSDDGAAPGPTPDPVTGADSGSDGGGGPPPDERPDGGGGDSATPVTVAELGTGELFACARFSDGTVKCWGDNAFGQLGQGNTDTVRGNLAALSPIPLGTGTRAIALAVGSFHACVVLDDGGVKCWGKGENGQLGLGDTNARGDGPNEMGDALPLVDLGAGVKAVQISAGASHTCAILDDDRTKCWGGNAHGQLGLGDTDTRGDGPNEMGASLTAVDLGPDRIALEISAGFLSTCARLDDATVKCWGWNASGQLGLGDNVDRGTQPGQMGASLPAVDLGPGRTATQVSTGGGSTCARLDDGTLKCWGAKIGMFGVVSEAVGDEAGEMAALAPVPLGAGRTVARIAHGSGLHFCARLDDGALKCWGDNGSGRLGLGDTVTRATAAELGDALPAVNLGAGRTASIIAIGASSTCARLDDDSVKCWGANGDGQLGLGDTESRGDDAGEMGDALPALAF